MVSPITVRAPGRVNLIGEHTDYSGLPVLPIAVDRCLVLTAQADGSNVIRATSAQFPEAGTLPREGDPPRPTGWLRYLAGALNELTDVARGRGATIHVTGDLPATRGLSSSSALAVAAIAGLGAAWGADLGREDVVRRAVMAERRLGVETGGMDPEVIAFAEHGHALRIDFMPRERRNVRIPDGLAFVVAYSGEEAQKAGPARDAHNERVVGARMAAFLLADQVGVDLDQPPTLGQVAGIEVVDILVDDLPEKTSAHTVAHGADVDVARIVQLAHATVDARANLPVRHVARHILSEAQRVGEAEAALRAADLQAFGSLLNASHDSLRQDFRCSTPALDRMCAAMRKAGAYGARLTGAGFGGWGLAGCPPDAVSQVIQAAIAATGGPAFQVHASRGYELL